MKRLFLLVVIVAILLPSCKKINEAIDDLNNRVTELENTTIPTINEQIANINTSIADLEAADVELKNYITALQGTAAELQKSIDDTDTKIDNVKTTLQGEISTAKADVLAQLEALRTEMNNELSQINSTIDTLQAKDTELEGKITELRNYVDTELKNTKDWATATFSTLEQYNALCSEIATIKTQIENLNMSISELETRLNTKIATDIATAVKGLQGELADAVTDITNSYTSAISTAKEEITASYTAAIQSAISALESSMKQWVNEQLANYYTIAQIDAKISALQRQIQANGTEELINEINTLKSSLQSMKSELTTAYQKAITDAINTNNGVINAKIAEEIATVYQRIANEVATINAKIAEIESRLDNVEAKIAELLARIQSISYIPTYSDGKATVRFADGISHVTLDFEVSPKDAVTELAKVWQSAVSVKAIYTQTRAVSFIDMPIMKFESDPVNGVISVTASGENLSAEFFNGTQSTSARLTISDNNNFATSEYIPLLPRSENVNNVPWNQIYYTTTDNKRVFPVTAPTVLFNAILVSNTYDEGVGILTFDNAITFIYTQAFNNCSKLKRIYIPNSITSIENYAFSGCTSLTSITIPNSVKSIRFNAFYNCSSLTSATIGSGVTSIGRCAFENCTKLSRVYCKAATPPTGEDQMFYNTASNLKIYVPRNSVSAYKSKAYWCAYTIEPYDFE